MATKKNTKKAESQTKKNTPNKEKKIMKKSAPKKEDNKQVAEKKETAKKAAPKKETTEKKEDTPFGQKNNKQVVEKKEEKFVAFCGSNYDPDKNSECELSCKIDMPEEHSKCVAHFKMFGGKSSDKKTAAKKASSKKNVKRDFLGYRLGTRAAGINEMLKEGATAEEMTAAFDSTDNATKTHLYQLKKRNGMDIFRIPGTNKYIYNDGEHIADNVPIGCVDNEAANGQEVPAKAAEDFKPTKIMKQMEENFQKLIG